jgi:hypothetical protein
MNGSTKNDKPVAIATYQGYPSHEQQKRSYRRLLGKWKRGEVETYELQSHPYYKNVVLSNGEYHIRVTKTMVYRNRNSSEKWVVQADTNHTVGVRELWRKRFLIYKLLDNRTNSEQVDFCLEYYSVHRGGSRIYVGCHDFPPKDIRMLMKRVEEIAKEGGWE